MVLETFEIHTKEIIDKFEFRYKAFFHNFSNYKKFDYFWYTEAKKSKVFLTKKNSIFLYKYFFLIPKNIESDLALKKNLISSGGGTAFTRKIIRSKDKQQNSRRKSNLWTTHWGL